jgi:hypothetical protein
MNELTETKKHAYCVKALEKKHDLETNYLELGSMLHTIKDERLYEAGWESWEEYSMELKMSQSAISRMLRIYEVFILQYHVPVKQLADAGGWTVLSELLPAIKEDTTRDRVKELVEIASGQTRTDLQRTMKEVKGGEVCRHKKTHILTLEICDDCGERWRQRELHDHEK